MTCTKKDAQRKGKALLAMMKTKGWRLNIRYCHRSYIYRLEHSSGLFLLVNGKSKGVTYWCSFVDYGEAGDKMYWVERSISFSKDPNRAVANKLRAFRKFVERSTRCLSKMHTGLKMGCGRTK